MMLMMNSKRNSYKKKIARNSLKTPAGIPKESPDAVPERTSREIPETILEEGTFWKNAQEFQEPVVPPIVEEETETAYNFVAGIIVS